MFRVEKDTTWSVTQVGLKLVGSGLGGHDAGVSGDDEGVENKPFPSTKRRRMALSNCATFSDFISVEFEFAGENRNCKNNSDSSRSAHSTILVES